MFILTRESKILYTTRHNILNYLQNLIECGTDNAIAHAL